MKTLNVTLKDRRYPIQVGAGALAGAGAFLRKQGFKSAPVVVSNPTVMRLHGKALLASLEGAFGKTPVIKIGDGERFKSHETLLGIYGKMFELRASRGSWILAFGGGVVGDIAGFAAATFMRGIPYAMAPTTLLSQVDSSIGGKTAVNVPQGKNLVGAFYQPSAVLADTEVLKTLPKRELASGLYEVVKYGAICSKGLLGYLEKHLGAILACGARELEHVVLESARIKADVVALDERETGLRTILNYGHTVGHAFEAATHYRKFKHGEGVAWGMVAALRYGREVGLLDEEDAGRLVRIIHGVGKLPPVRNIPFDDVWSALMRDKKFQAGDIRMVLLKGLGEAAIYNGLEREPLRDFLRRFLKES
ncbi:MAG: 3-dehydroquinate synthase [Acidobacteriota bacterium]|jgi:3-dehydroquinate synthase|nr:3-dehydroquinate synthase [Acidobacteriota bacterium]